MEIKITLDKKTDEKGNPLYDAIYNPEDLKPLCLALLSDMAMKETATLAACYIASQEDNMEDYLQHIRDFAAEIRRENEKDNLNNS